MPESSIKKTLIGLFFAIFLLIGLTVYKDYGVHFDEYQNQSLGRINYDYISSVFANHSFDHAPSFDKNPNLNHTLIHGPFFETLLIAFQEALKLNDSRDILFMRHLICFISFFIGTAFFYLLCNLYFRNWKISLLGCLFLTLSPRIFAQSFYDTVGIPFLSFYILCMYSLLRLMVKKNIPRLTLHALTTALLITTRQLGLIMVGFTGLLLILDLIKANNIQTRLRILWYFLIYICLLTIFVIACWPLLWQDPLGHFIESMKSIIQCQNPIGVFYMGKSMDRTEVPWHYGPVWILISTPLYYSFLFFIGLISIIVTFFKNLSFGQLKITILMLAFFLVPLLASKGAFYDSWRVMFFIYPAFLTISLKGLVDLLHSPLRRVIIGITALALIFNACTMIRIHPFENVYFNNLAGSSMQQIKNKFDLDYWGLSYRQGLEYILKNDPRQDIKVSCDEGTSYIVNNIPILSIKDRSRIKSSSIDTADYYLSNFRGHNGEYPYEEFGGITLDGAKILGIYKLKTSV